MTKPPNITGKFEWVGIDLHVHTPASKDYEGPDETNEYVAIIKRANEFEDPNIALRKIRTKNSARPIKCIAFTDHNSIDGFLKWRTICDETLKLSESIRDRDSNNTLLAKLDDDLSILRSVRVLMGCEVKAYPGVHLLLIFHESIAPEAAITFLSEIYQKSYSEINGIPAPTTVARLEELMDKVLQTFGERVLIIAPHIENKGGIHETLKDLGQVRMKGLTHDALRALTFNKEETREKVRNLFTQPEYARAIPLAFIQASDAHGMRGTVGQPRTEVHVPDGKINFTSIKEAFLHPNRVKCSVDFADEEYKRLCEGEAVAKFSATINTFKFSSEDNDQIAQFACAALNSDNGIIQLDVNTTDPNAFTEVYPARVRTDLLSILKRYLDPELTHVLTRALLFSANRIRILYKLFGTNRLYTISGSVYVLDKGKARLACTSEIEAIVAERINSRFGTRFQNTLERVSKDSILLSKLPEGIPLFIRCREKLSFLDAKTLELNRFDGISSKGKDQLDEAKRLYDDASKLGQFGQAKGNTSFVWQRDEVRNQEHYTRFMCFRTDLKPETAEKYSATLLGEASIIISNSGASYICEPGYVITKNPIVSLQLSEKWNGHKLACLAWLKSSFFIWYCAVHLSDKNVYQQCLNVPRLPFPALRHEELYQRLKSLAQNIVIEEKRFLDEIQRETKRGCDADYRDKLRQKHNNSASNISLAIDEEILKSLSLSRFDSKFVSQTMKDMELTDFGLLDKLEMAEKLEEEELGDP